VTVKNIGISMLSFGGKVKRNSVDKSFHLSKAYHHCRLRLSNLSDADPIVVYQMGKVGSSTIKTSLVNLRLGMPVYQVHWLAQESIDQVLANHADAKKVPASHIWESQFLCRKIVRGIEGKNWKIVTLVREPIARNLSAFFQNIHKWFPDFNSRFQSRSITIEQLIDCFLEEFPHHEPLNWFDSEMKKILKIDVFACDFPQSQGYKIYEGSNVSVLLLRTEDIHQCSRDAFQEFLGIEDFEVINDNTSNEKEYFPAYREVLDSIRLPDGYLDRMYSSKLSQHFYCREAISRFREKWCGKKSVD